MKDGGVEKRILVVVVVGIDNLSIEFLENRVGSESEENRADCWNFAVGSEVGFVGIELGQHGVVDEKRKWRRSSWKELWMGWRGNLNGIV